MVRCPNCGQKTSGKYCQWCKYPILKARPARFRRVRSQIKKDAKLVAKEEARKQAEEAQKANLAKKQAEQDAALAAKEEARKQAEEAKEIKQAEKSLKEIEKTCEQLKAGKIDTKEAIQRLRDITERISG